MPNHQIPRATAATATLATYLPQFAKEPLEFQPGTRWNYSNTVAFDTLARIVEVVSGKAYEDVLRERGPEAVRDDLAAHGDLDVIFTCFDDATLRLYEKELAS